MPSTPGSHDLTTFGAVIKFAIETELAATKFYDTHAQASARANWSNIFMELSRLHQKRKLTLERVRREKLNEIMLEPITGLNCDNYVIKLDTELDHSDVTKLLQTAHDIELRCIYFYRDTAKIAKSFSTEVTKIFERLAKENENFKAKLDTLT